MTTITHMDRVDELLASWREAGEVEALGELLRWQRDRACALACGILDEQADAEDAVQQAFVKLLSRRKGFEDRAAFTAAVTRAVVQCAIDLLRSRRSRGRHQEAFAAMHQPQAAVADALADRERDLAVRAALAELPEDERLALVLCCQDGHSVAEGARLLDLPRETLRHRLKRGLGRMRSSLSSRGVVASTVAIGAGLCHSAQAASPQLCAALDASLPGPACAAVSAAPAGLGLGAQVAAVTAAGAVTAGVGISLAPVGIGLGTLALGAAITVGVLRPEPIPNDLAASSADQTSTIHRSEDMHQRIIGAALATAAALAPVAAKEIPISQLPQAVIDAVTADGATIVKAKHEIDDGVTVYEVEVRLGTAEKDYEVAEDGTVLELEEEIAPEDLPQAVRDALPLDDAVIVEASRDTEQGEISYDVELRRGTASLAYEIAADGTVLQIEEELTPDEVPQEIRASLEAAVPGFLLIEAERETEGDEVEWKFEGREGDNEIEIEIDAEGKLEIDRKEDRRGRGRGRGGRGQEAGVEADAPMPPPPADF